ncbi:MAG: hypothetical protein KAI61_02950 [Alphaproteobacteria bacterium]|nr:hypothetical protein [Alphaproteobacteria bacterium]MCK5658815.1 hypothetical protein [Alphaproteobacteria bacterium]
MTDSALRDNCSLIKMMRHPRLVRGSGRLSSRHMTYKTRGRGHDGGDKVGRWL